MTQKAIAISAPVASAWRPMRYLRGLRVIYPVVLVLFLWEVCSRVGIFDPYLIPPFSAVLATLYSELFITGDIWVHIAASVERISIGYSIAAVTGISVGIAMGRLRHVAGFFDPLISAVYPTPKLALYPVMMALIGIGDASKITLIALASFFPIVINTHAGVKNIDHFLIWNARTKGASTRQVLWTVILPGSMPFIFMGLRVALAQAFLLIVATEMIAANEGLGYIIMFSQSTLNQTLMFSGVLLIALIGFTATQLLLLVERRMFVWRRNNN